MMYAIVFVWVVVAVIIVLGLVYVSRMNEDLREMQIQMDKIIRVLTVVEHRTCVYYPPDRSGYNGTAGMHPDVLGGTLNNNNWYIPLRAYLTALMEHLGLNMTRTPAVDSKLIVRSSDGTVEKI